MPIRIALTGATGFIGTTVLRHLTAAGYTVRALYRPRAGRIPPLSQGVEWLAGDLHDDAALIALVAQTDAVVHCAGAVRGAGRADFDPINERAAGRLAAAAARQASAPRFLLISSLAARAPELSHYAGSKARGEQAIKAASAGLRWAVFRPPAVYGPGDREMAPLFRAIAGGYLPAPTAADGRFSLLYVDDLASAVVRWLGADAAHGETFELDDGHSGGYDWDSVRDIAGRALRPGRRVRRVPIPLPLLKLAAHANLVGARLLGYAPMLTPGKVREIIHADWVCDSAHLRRAIGWQPRFGLEQGLGCTYGQANAHGTVGA